MVTHRRNEITIETDRVLIIRRRRWRRVWCQQCGRDVDAIGLQEVRSVAGGTLARLPGNAESEAWHVCTGQDGEPVFCLESLLKTR